MRRRARGVLHNVQMKLKRPFTVAETGLMDSEWELEHPSGKFNIEVRSPLWRPMLCAV